jgi:hypothetical protein
MSKDPNQLKTVIRTTGLDDEIFEAIRQEGWLIPQTVEEVLAAERQLASEHIEVPHYLAKPPALRGQRPLSIVKPRASSSFAQEGNSYPRSQTAQRHARPSPR